MLFSRCGVYCALFHRACGCHVAAIAMAEIDMQIANFTMEDIETAWQNAESLRDKYVKHTYDPNTAGGKLSKGCLYCPVFEENYYSLYFLTLPVQKLLLNISDVNEGVVDVNGVNEGVAAVSAVNVGADHQNPPQAALAPQAPVTPSKRPRTDSGA